MFFTPPLDIFMSSWLACPMTSMTGHGRGTAAATGISVTVECASVNRKQLDLAIQLPREWAGMEPAIREEAASFARRGRVQIQVTGQASAGHQRQMIDNAAAKTACANLRKLQRELKLDGEVTLAMVLQCPGVLLAASPPSSDPAKAWPMVKKALRVALTQMRAMREREGDHLRKELEKQGKTLSRHLVQLRKLAPAVVIHHRRHLEQRLKNAGLELGKIEHRLIEELAVFAERCDITEELTRLESHLEQYFVLLQGDEAAGRTLEFLTQEIFRELNTAGSKSNDARISQLVVDCKSGLDKIREQILNLE